MSEVQIEISGSGAKDVALDLTAFLDRSGDRFEVSDPDVEKAVDPLVLMGIGFVGNQIAAALWRWWDGRESGPASVTIVFENGDRVELDEASEKALQVRVQQETGTGDADA